MTRSTTRHNCPCT